MEYAIHIAAVVAALGCGLMAGLFFAFSVAVMKALGRLPPAEGMAAMQSINATILNPLFFAAFFGTAAACALGMIASLLHWQNPGSGYLLAGGALYLAGDVLVTVLFNVPLNNRLARSASSDAGSDGVWAGYLARWTAWNHVRTAAALAACALLILALLEYA